MRKGLDRIAFGLMVCGLLVGWELGFWAGAGVTPLSPFTLDGWLEQGKEVVLVDVRTHAEHGLFHIPGSRHMPEALSAITMDLLGIPEDTPLVLLCMTGHRSSWAAARLHHAGFKEVYSLTGGTLGWLVTGHGVEWGEE